MKNRYIIIYPFKFVDTLYSIYVLDDFSDETEVAVLDISRIFNKKFSDSIAAPSTLYQIKKIRSLRRFIADIKDIKKQSLDRKTCVHFMVPFNSLIAFTINFICYLNFKDSKIKVLNTINTGLPNFAKKTKMKRLFNAVSQVFSIRIFINRIFAFLWSRLPSPMASLVTHKLVAGKYYLEIERNKNTNCSVNIIKGHSYDYDRYLASSSLNSGEKAKNKIVFLDSPGPLFSSDYAYTGDKEHKTIDTWYPSLCKFFDHLELLFDAKVVIAAHYKSNFTSCSEVFGGREVYYGRTNELIAESKLVITEQSSAVSYAVIYEKPILFIYSDELKDDHRIMRFSNNISKILGQPHININQLDSIPHKLPGIDENLYHNYKDSFLTSDPDSLTNARKIEAEILN